MLGDKRLWISIIIGGALGSISGYFTEQNWPDSLPPNGTVVGAVFGVLLGLTVGLYLQQQKRRWIVGALLVVIVGAAYGAGGYWDALLAAASVAITFFISSAVLKDLYGGNEIAAFKHHLQILFGGSGGFVIVENGKITVPKGKGLIFGPRTIMVKPGNVVVMESGTKITRVCGPSMFQSRNFEYIKDIIDITKDRKSSTLSQLLTGDMIPANVEMTYVFGIAVSAQTIRGDNSSLVQRDGSQGITQYEWQSLRNLITTVPKWQQYVHEVVAGAARETIASETLQNLATMTDYGILANRIQDRARRRLAILGITIDSTRVTRVLPAAQIVEALEEAERIRTREHANGDGWRLAMAEIVIGYLTASGGRTMTTDEVYRESHRLMMEHISNDKATKIVVEAEH